MNNIVIQIFYLLGVAACVFHLANGVWTMGITWGLWTTPESQKRANRFSILVGVLMGIVGLAAWWGARSVDIPAAIEQEDELYKARVSSGMVDDTPHKRSAPKSDE